MSLFRTVAYFKLPSTCMCSPVSRQLSVQNNAYENVFHMQIQGFHSGRALGFHWQAKHFELNNCISQTSFLMVKPLIKPFFKSKSFSCAKFCMGTPLNTQVKGNSQMGYH